MPFIENCVKRKTDHKTFIKRRNGNEDRDILQRI